MIILKPRRVKILHKSFVPILIDRNYQLSDSHPADILCWLSFPNLLALCLYVKNFSATRYFYLVLSCLPSFPNFFSKIFSRFQLILCCLVAAKMNITFITKKGQVFIY